MKKATRVLLALLVLPLLVEFVKANTNFAGGGVTITGTPTFTVAASTVAVTNVNGQSLNVAATLSAETTKVIGTVNVSAGQSIATTNAGTFAVQNNAATPAGTNNIGTVTGSTITVSGMPKCGGVPVQTAVGCTTSSAQLIAGNANRCGLEIDADAAPDNTDKVFLNYGSVSATNSMKRLELGASWQPPVISTVAVQCLAKSGTQNVRVVEYNYQ